MTSLCHPTLARTILLCTFKNNTWDTRRRHVVFFFSRTRRLVAWSKGSTMVLSALTDGMLRGEREIRACFRSHWKIHGVCLFCFVFPHQWPHVCLRVPFCSLSRVRVVVVCVFPFFASESYDESDTSPESKAPFGNRHEGVRTPILAIARVRRGGVEEKACSSPSAQRHETPLCFAGVLYRNDYSYRSPQREGLRRRERV